MYSDRVYQIAFLISLITHGFIFLKVSALNTSQVIKNKQKIEITYVKTPRDSQGSGQKEGKKDSFQKLSAKISTERKTLLPFVNKENIFRGTAKNILSEPNLAKPALIKPDVIAVKKKITLPEIGGNRINNPSYMGYYQIVREKIRRAAYQNYAHTDTGEVYLTFIITNDGALREVRLVEEKSSPCYYLKQIALNSIKEASPFPVFPKELTYPQLSFNVVISFEIEK